MGHVILVGVVFPKALYAELEAIIGVAVAVIIDKVTYFYSTRKCCRYGVVAIGLAFSKAVAVVGGRVGRVPDGQDLVSSCDDPSRAHPSGPGVIEIIGEDGGLEIDVIDDPATIRIGMGRDS